MKRKSTAKHRTATKRKTTAKRGTKKKRATKKGVKGSCQFTVSRADRIRLNASIYNLSKAVGIAVKSLTHVIKILDRVK